MKFKIDKNECWIKNGVTLPSNFDSMNDDEKWLYIIWSKLLHRLNGPAIIYPNKTEWWYLNGIVHRINGPAIIYEDGYQEWWLNNIPVKKEMYQKIQNSSKEELLMYKIDPNYKDYLPLIEYELNRKA